MSQKERVLNYLERYGSITSIECYEKLRIVDLQRAIFLLRKENGYGRPVKFKRYSLEG